MSALFNTLLASGCLMLFTGAVWSAYMGTVALLGAIRGWFR